MKKITKTFLLIILLSAAAAAQVKINSVGFNGIYSNSFSLRKDLQISKANSLGAELNVEFGLGESICLSLQGGYQEFDIKQDEFALFKEWNWRAWKRYYGDINDKNFINSTQWVQSILKDPGYSANFNTVQKMDFYPVVLVAQYKLKASDDLTITPGIGGGVLFYSADCMLKKPGINCLKPSAIILIRIHTETWLKIFQEIRLPLSSRLTQIILLVKL